MTSEQQTGLIAASGAHPEAITLKSVSVRARVSGPCVEVTLVQRYQNMERVPIEAVYVFPLDEAAAVCGFKARIGPSVVIGKVEEREQAFARYDDALTDGDAAFLLEQERPNVFTASVGNLLAGEQVELELRYVAKLEREGEAVRLNIPTTVAPRYVGKAAPSVGQPDGERVNPEQRDSVPYGLQLAVEIAGRVSSVDSPSHPIRTRLGPEAVSVELSQEDVALDRDFVLLITQEHAPGKRGANAYVAREADGRRVALLSFAHTLLPTPGVGHEVIFVLDCSGSMEGSSITQARRALSLCIRALSSDDTFNVVRFGSSFESLFAEGPRRFDEATLQLATRYVEQTEADLGGTEILAPLTQVLRTALDPVRPRRVLLLTDGQVANEAALIALAREHATTARVFTFGIGASASAYLVRGLARASRAASELIFPGERIEPKVLRMFERVRTPVLDDVRIDWGGLTVEQAPSELPALFAGDELTVFARIVSGAASEVRLHAGGEAWSVPIELERAEAAGPIPTLWARECIRSIEERSERADAGQHESGARATRPSERESARHAQLVELGVRYQLLSSATSFVAVEERTAEQRSKQPAQLRRIPVALSDGQGERRGSSGGHFVGAMLPMMMAAPVPTGAPFTAGPPEMVALAHGSDMDTSAPALRSRVEVPRASTAREELLDGSRSLLGRALGFLTGQGSAASGSARDEDEETPDRLYELLMTQHADGCFASSEVLLTWLGSERVARLAAPIAQHGEAIVLTAVVVWLLAREAKDRQAEWRPAVSKARGWIAAQSTQLDAASLMDG